MKRQTNNLFQCRDEVPCQVSLCDTEFSFFSLLLVFPNLYSCLICLLPSTLCKLTVYLNQLCLLRKNFLFFWGGGEVILVLNFPCQYNFPATLSFGEVFWLIDQIRQQARAREVPKYASSCNQLTTFTHHPTFFFFILFIS